MGVCRTYWVVRGMWGVLGVFGVSVYRYIWGPNQDKPLISVEDKHFGGFAYSGRGLGDFRRFRRFRHFLRFLRFSVFSAFSAFSAFRGIGVYAYTPIRLYGNTPYKRRG